MRKTVHKMTCLSAAAAISLAALVGCASDPGTDESSAPATSQTTAGPDQTPTAATSIPAGAETVSATEVVERVQQNMSTLQTYTATATQATGDRINTATTTVDRSDPDQIKSQGKLEDESGTTEVIQIGNTRYELMPGASMWTRTDDAPGYTDIDLTGSLADAQQAVLIGEETVEGIGTRHYVLIDQGGYEVHLYVDSDDRLVKMSGQADGSSMDVVFSDFNEPTDITAPDESKVATP